MFCWHRWDRWEEYDLHQEVLLNPIAPGEWRVGEHGDLIKTITTKFQKRQCSKCGKTQRERVR